MVVKWSACLPSTLTIQVRIPLEPTVSLVNFVFEKNTNIQKEAVGGPFKKPHAIKIREICPPH